MRPAIALKGGGFSLLSLRTAFAFGSVRGGSTRPDIFFVGLPAYIVFRARVVIFDIDPGS